MSASKSVGQIINYAANMLAQIGIDNSRIDVELLLAFVLKMNRAELICSTQKAIGARDEERFNLLLNRRLKFEPIAYILGEKEFMGLNFSVGPEVLIPRSDTELLVEKALEFLAEKTGGKKVIDLCTGSGCVGLAIAHYCPDAVVYCSDISPKAIAMARCNAEKLALSHRINFQVGDLLQPFAIYRNIDLICANPPYISPAEYAALMPDVKNFEPELALIDPCGDGVNLHRKILEQAKDLLSIGGQLMLEIGYNQRDLIENIDCTGFSKPIIIADYAAHDRCAVFIRE